VDASGTTFKVLVGLLAATLLVRVATHPASRVDDLLPERWVATVAAVVQAEPALV
jgi:hypothetical protein